MQWVHEEHSWPSWGSTYFFCWDILRIIYFILFLLCINKGWWVINIWMTNTDNNIRKGKEKPKTLRSQTFIGYYSMRTCFAYFTTHFRFYLPLTIHQIIHMFLTTEKENSLIQQNIVTYYKVYILKVFDHLNWCLCTFLFWCTQSGRKYQRSINNNKTKMKKRINNIIQNKVHDCLLS
jgi:hypothetical protein